MHRRCACDALGLEITMAAEMRRWIILVGGSFFISSKISDRFGVASTSWHYLARTCAQ